VYAANPCSFEGASLTKPRYACGETLAGCGKQRHATL
jgi:hypothetical protein